MDPQQLRHLLAGAGLRGLSQIEGLQSLVLLHSGLRGKEPFSLLGRLSDPGYGLFHGDLLQRERRSSQAGTEGPPVTHHCQGELV
jgi:hypothetical protein